LANVNRKKPNDGKRDYPFVKMNRQSLAKTLPQNKEDFTENSTVRGSEVCSPGYLLKETDSYCFSPGEIVLDANTNVLALSRGWQYAGMPVGIKKGKQY
jgi:hypothetical protein